MNTTQQTVKSASGQTQWQTSVSAAAAETPAGPKRVTRTFRVSSVKPAPRRRRKRAVRQVQNPLDMLRTSLPAD